MKHLVFFPIGFFIPLLIILGNSPAQKGIYPFKVDVVTEIHANYLSPENTFAAGFSALMNHDLEWYYETLTKAAAEEDKAMFEKAGLDLNEKFKLINPGDQLIILEKKNYKEGILIHSKGITREGTIYTGPNVFVLENGLWKETFDYITDEEVHTYMDIAPPEQILSADIRLFPRHWNYRWYKQILDKKHSRRHLKLEKISVLCLLGNLRDSNGNIRSVEDIDPETLVLNYIVRPLPWRYGSKKDMAVFINSKKPFRLPNKSFDQWEKQQHLRRNFQGPVMMIKFSKFEAINSLDDLNPEKTYTISVSGKLKDKETHFRGETQIKLIPSKLPKDQHKKTSSSAVKETINEQYWWDKMD